ncbi:unnamed protein product [Closterium sp. Naga37s-1]|nr:unnamed protein product [Closterium sp. Naga37s-1]
MDSDQPEPSDSAGKLLHSKAASPEKAASPVAHNKAAAASLGESQSEDSPVEFFDCLPSPSSSSSSSSFEVLTSVLPSPSFPAPHSQPPLLASPLPYHHPYPPLVLPPPAAAAPPAPDPWQAVYDLLLQLKQEAAAAAAEAAEAAETASGLQRLAVSAAGRAAAAQAEATAAAAEAIAAAEAAGKAVVASTLAAGKVERAAARAAATLAAFVVEADRGDQAAYAILLPLKQVAEAAAAEAAETASGLQRLGASAAGRTAAAQAEATAAAAEAVSAAEAAGKAVVASTLAAGKAERAAARAAATVAAFVGEADRGDLVDEEAAEAVSAAEAAGKVVVESQIAAKKAERAAARVAVTIGGIFGKGDEGEDTGEGEERREIQKDDLTEVPAHTEEGIKAKGGRTGITGKREVEERLESEEDDLPEGRPYTEKGLQTKDPPVDSSASREGFVRGGGVEEEMKRKREAATVSTAPAPLPHLPLSPYTVHQSQSNLFSDTAAFAVFPPPPARDTASSSKAPSTLSRPASNTHSASTHPPSDRAGRCGVLVVHQGDITKWFVDGTSDAIVSDCKGSVCNQVNAANESVLGGGGVDGAIHRAAGSNLVKLCYDLPVRNGIRCKTGDSVTTGAADLPVRYVIHAVGPRYHSERVSAPLLKSAYRSILREANKCAIKHVAICAISCGIFGYPPQKGAQAAIEVLCNEQWGSVQEVHFVLFDQRMLGDWLAAIHSAKLPQLRLERPPQQQPPSPKVLPQQLPQKQQLSESTQQPSKQGVKGTSGKKSKQQVVEEGGGASAGPAWKVENKLLLRQQRASESSPQQPAKQAGKQEHAQQGPQPQQQHKLPPKQVQQQQEVRENPLQQVSQQTRQRGELLVEKGSSSEVAQRPQQQEELTWKQQQEISEKLLQQVSQKSQQPAPSAAAYFGSETVGVGNASGDTGSGGSWDLNACEGKREWPEEEQQQRQEKRKKEGELEQGEVEEESGEGWSEQGEEGCEEETKSAPEEKLSKHQQKKKRKGNKAKKGKK